MDTVLQKPLKRAGRSRDPLIDARILTIAREQLSSSGYDAMSLTTVAYAAGTTRQALYRRWASKADLAAAVVAESVDGGGATASDAPYEDLVSELQNFQDGVSRPGRMSLVGTMLQDNTSPELRSRYQEQVIAPRRSRIRSYLARAGQLGLIDSNADLDVAVTLCTGSWYARALAGVAPPADWPRRTANLVWRAVGGTPPTDR
ncbi:MAG TPA: TetR/AcrR family transcriptional regulator [Galbitalea sp.]|jgi:AcrR family transcriptional regulator|nr:TetR/AcrR family transcriptional regulator [Galbitalea sp.]